MLRLNNILNEAHPSRQQLSTFESLLQQFEEKMGTDKFFAMTAAVAKTLEKKWILNDKPSRAAAWSTLYRKYPQALQYTHQALQHVYGPRIQLFRGMSKRKDTNKEYDRLLAADGRNVFLKTYKKFTAFSWTVNKRTALSFTGPLPISKFSTKDSILLTATVPVRQILWSGLVWPGLDIGDDITFVECIVDHSAGVIKALVKVV